MYFYFFMQFLKVTLHLQLYQNIGSIPRVVKYIFVAYLTPSNQIFFYYSYYLKNFLAAQHAGS